MNKTIDAAESLAKQHDRNPAILAGLLLPHIVCTVFVAARAWSRLRILRKWFIDDTLMVLAWVISTGVCVVYTLAAESHNLQKAVITTTTSADTDGNRQLRSSGWDVTTRQYLFRTYLGLIFYQVCLCLTKFSILSFYLRMFGTWRPLERRLAWATVTFVVAFGIPLLFASIFLCHPATGTSFLVSSTETDQCFPFTPLLIASASLHTTTDAWLIALVIPCVWRLDIAPRQKAALGVVLSLGIFVIAASLTRLQLSLHANYMPVGGEGGGGGGAGNTLAFFVMTILECDVALICASAPTLRPLLARLWPRSGMGDPLVFRRRSRHHHHYHHRQNRRRIVENSVNLTSVVSFHGYPWVAKTVAMGPEIRSQSPSPDGSSPKSGAKRPLALGDIYPPRKPPPEMPVPPVPALTTAHRTPTTLSLKSLMSVVSPRGRAVTVTNGEDGAVLLLLGDGDGRGRLCRARTWSQSQESFVMGINDPASPQQTSFVIGGHRGPGEGWLSGETVVVGGSRPVTSDETKDKAEDEDSGLQVRRCSAPADQRSSRGVCHGDAKEAGT